MSVLDPWRIGVALLNFFSVSSLLSFKTSTSVETGIGSTTLTSDGLYVFKSTRDCPFIVGKTSTRWIGFDCFKAEAVNENKTKMYETENIIFILRFEIRNFVIFRAFVGDYLHIMFWTNRIEDFIHSHFAPIITIIQVPPITLENLFFIT